MAGSPGGVYVSSSGRAFALVPNNCVGRSPSGSNARCHWSIGWPPVTHVGDVPGWCRTEVDDQVDASPVGATNDAPAEDHRAMTVGRACLAGSESKRSQDQIEGFGNSIECRVTRRVRVAGERARSSSAHLRCLKRRGNRPVRSSRSPPPAGPDGALRKRDLRRPEGVSEVRSSGATHSPLAATTRTPTLARPPVGSRLCSRSRCNR
jgi:hypothetical protein